MCVNDMNKSFKSVMGLFFPLGKDEEGHFVYTLMIGRVPLGWIILGVSLLTSYLTR